MPSNYMPCAFSIDFYDCYCSNEKKIKKAIAKIFFLFFEQTQQANVKSAQCTTYIYTYCTTAMNLASLLHGTFYIQFFFYTLF